MRNKQRIEKIENMANAHSSDSRPAFTFPSEVYQKKEIIYKVIDEINGHSTSGKMVAILPDNLRDEPDEMFNEVLKRVIIREGREDLLKFIRTE